MASPADTLKSLNSARDIVLRDHSLYPQVVPGVLQVIAPAAQLDLRRWGAEFLAEAFASQAVTADEKQEMSTAVLDTLQGYLTRKETMGEEEDINVVKSTIQCAASIYPYVFRRTAGSQKDKEPWTKMAKIKSSILRGMDAASPGVKICCIKFIACVVQIQTPGLIADPRRPEQNEISLALVPRDHSFMPPANLEAEASGLLDRLLGVLEDNLTDPLIITATLNSLATLVQRRASISTKILTTILNFNPLKLASTGVPSGRDKVAIRSMTRTTMSFLLNCLKRNPNNSFANRIQQQVERLKHSLTEVFSENQHLKRPAPDEPIDGLDHAKRQRVDAEAENGTTPLQQKLHSTSSPAPGPVSLAQIWTLTDDQQSSTFHVERLPAQVVTQLIPALIAPMAQEKIDQVINVVRSRWLELERSKSDAQVAKTTNKEDDDDDYDPTLSFDVGSGLAANNVAQMPLNAVAQDMAIGPFHFSPPPPLTEEDRQEYSKTAFNRIFTTLSDLDKEAKARGKSQPAQQGFNALAATSAAVHERDGWLALLTRLATRASFDLDDGAGESSNGTDKRSLVQKGPPWRLASTIREALFTYVMENFRGRIDVAVAWLNEEWYSDRILQKQHRDDDTDVDDDDAGLQNYWHWTLKLLDAMMPFLDVKDGKVLIRLLSEVPAINGDVLDRVKKIADDPERVQLTSNALLYLIMLRPPVRQLAIDCAEALYQDNTDAKAAAKKILSKWRPAAIEQGGKVDIKTEAT